MNRPELRAALARSMQELYDLELFTSMVEFCQGELRVLLCLHLRDGHETFPRDLSESLCVSRQRITSILSSLRKKGYVEMEISADDRRKVAVMLTTAGKQHALQKATESEKRLDSLIDGLGERNVHELTRLINLTICQFGQQ